MFINQIIPKKKQILKKRRKLEKIILKKRDEKLEKS